MSQEVWCVGIRIALIGVLFAGGSGCGAGVDAPDGTTPRPRARAEAELIGVDGSTFDVMSRALTALHSASVDVVDAIGVGVDDDLAVVYALYAYSAFDAWQGTLELAGVSDEAEREMWETTLSGESSLERYSADVEEILRTCEERADEELEIQQQQHDSLIAEAEACYDEGRGGEDESSYDPCQTLYDLAQDALRASPHDACTEQAAWREAVGSGVADRFGVALFSGPTGGRSNVASGSIELNGRVVLDGSMIGAIPVALEPIDLDGDGEQELVVELRWEEPTSDEPDEEILRSEHIELILFEHDTRLMLRHRLITNDERPGTSDRSAVARSTERQEARYWFEDSDADGMVEVVIERFAIAGSCDVGSCTRFARRGGAAPGAREPCFPGERPGQTAGCRVNDIERVVLRYDAEQRVWR